MGKVFCFGELLLRMSPELNRRWIERSAMPVNIAGAELNVATALAVWNLPVKYCTALPKNYLTDEILAELAEKKIDLSSVINSGNRIGTYYLPRGTDLKSGGVIYDRAHSSFSELMPGVIDWEEALKDCKWFHFSAINPALNENLAAVCKEALEAAQEKKLMISVDLNYRSRLWKYGKKPVEIMPSLVKSCNVIMGNIWSASELLEIPVDPCIHEKKSKEAYIVHARKTAQDIMKQYPSCMVVANTFRFSVDNELTYYATLDDQHSQTISPEFLSRDAVDMVGSGDCFMAGLIYGIYNKLSSREVIDFATAAAFGKLHEEGDTTKQTVEQVETLIQKYGKRTVYN